MNELTPLLRELLQQHESQSPFGVLPTTVEGVEFFWSRQNIPRTPMVYKPGIILISQGHKVGFLEGRRFEYNSSICLVVGVPIPFECESYGTMEEPLLGLRINIDLLELGALAVRLGGPPEQGSMECAHTHSGIGPATVDQELLVAAKRLVMCMRDPMDSKVLGPGARDEVVYRTLRGDKGHVLFGLTQHHTHYAAVSRVLQIVHASYKEQLAVADLASEAAMSTSAFHRAFRAVTGQAPLQYIKRVRLDKARELLVHQCLPVNVAAFEVGYESASQFSREYKRHFNVSPSEARADQT